MPLPDRPNLEYLKKLAKDRLPDLQSTYPSARLADAQLTVAREHGFASWRKLRAHLDSLAAPAPAPTDAAPTRSRSSSAPSIAVTKRLSGECSRRSRASSMPGIPTAPRR